MNDRARDERARRRRADEGRRAGGTGPQAGGAGQDLGGRPGAEGAEAERERAEKREQAKREGAARLEREEREKRAAFRDWTAQGGNPRDFEAEWPSMRAAATRRRVEESSAEPGPGSGLCRASRAERGHAMTQTRDHGGEVGS